MSGATPVAAATDYFVGAVRRLLTRIGDSPTPGAAVARVDTERFLRILALTPTGMTSAELGAVWRAEAVGLDNSPPHSSSWDHVSATIGTGAERRYIAPPDDPVAGRFRLLHPTLREALLRQPGGRGVDGRPGDSLEAPYEAISLAAERRRFLAGLTPIHGRGPGWDPDTGRLALAEVVPVIHDLAAQVLAVEPVNEAALAECHELLGRVLEDWEWMETCVRHVRPTDEIPLGVGVVVDGLARLVRLPGLDTDTPGLWTDGRWSDERLVEEAPVRPTRRPAGGTAPGPGHARAARTAEPRYLSVETPSGAELVSGFERRATREKALARLHHIVAGISRSRSLVDDDPDTPIVWIRGYAITPAEIQQGYRGQYARLSVRELPDGAWTIHVDKIDVELSRHPDRGRPARPHPNWGHPVLRRTENHPHQNGKPGRRYSSLALAQAELEQLKREFPETSILNEGLLFIMVFDRTQQPPIRRVRLEIRATGERSYVIVARPNEKSGTVGG